MARPPKYKSRDFSIWQYEYKPEYAQEFFRLCQEGKTIPEIAFEMGIPESQFESWKGNRNHKDFLRAYEEGMTALEAYHVADLQALMKLNTPKGIIDQKMKFMQMTFKRWGSKTAQEETVSIENVSEEDLNQQLLTMLKSPVLLRIVLSHLNAMVVQNRNLYKELELIVKNNVQEPIVDV